MARPGPVCLRPGPFPRCEAGHPPRGCRPHGVTSALGSAEDGEAEGVDGADVGDVVVGGADAGVVVDGDGPATLAVGVGSSAPVGDAGTCPGPAPRVGDDVSPPGGSVPAAPVVVGPGVVAPGLGPGEASATTRSRIWFSKARSRSRIWSSGTPW